MKIGYVGLGKMGLAQVELIIEKGHQVVAYNRSPKPRETAALLGVQTVESLSDLVSNLNSPRVIWLMVSHNAVDAVLSEIAPLLSDGDLVIDGGNSFYKDSIRRSKELLERAVAFLDIGVSGGPFGARNGASMMVGGNHAAFGVVEPLISDLCVPNGYAYVGNSGAGHFVKMVHNGIEYGMMQSIAEGFDLLKNNSEFSIDFDAVMKPYENGSVISSRLISWLSDAFRKYGNDLTNVSGAAAASGEGEWTIKTAREHNIRVGAIEVALNARLESQKTPNYQGKIVSAMRGEFGGHPVLIEEQDA